MATFITSKALGQTITIIVAASTGYWKYNHDGVDSAVYPSMGSDSNGIQATITNTNGEFTLIACTPDGTSPSYGYVGMVNLQNQQITSFNATALTDITWLKLSDNPLTSSINNQILHQLVLHGKHYGYFATTGGRTHVGNSDYNDLLTNAHWTLEGLNLIIVENNKLRVKGRSPIPPAGTSLILPFNPDPSEDGFFSESGFGTSTGYLKVTYWDGTSEVLGGGTPYNIIDDNRIYTYKQYLSTSANNGQVVITSCTSNGTSSGNILCVDIASANFGIGNVIGLTTLIHLTIGNNPSLTSLDVTGLSNLKELYVNNVPSLSSLNVYGLSYLTNLNIITCPLITSIDISNLISLIDLRLSSNGFDSSDIDNMLIQLDTNGLLSGNFFDVDVARTSTSDTAYSSLIGKGWTLQF